jgi:hypothetical protein
MAHGISHVEAHMSLIQSENIVEVAPDAIAKYVVNGEARASYPGERLGQQAGLDALGQFELVVQLPVKLAQARVGAI